MVNLNVAVYCVYMYIKRGKKAFFTFPKVQVCFWKLLFFTCKYMNQCRTNICSEHRQSASWGQRLWWAWPSLKNTICTLGSYRPVGQRNLKIFWLFYLVVSAYWKQLYIESILSIFWCKAAEVIYFPFFATDFKWRDILCANNFFKTFQ